MIGTPSVAAAEDVAAVGLRYKFLIVGSQLPTIYLVHGRVGNLDLMWLFRRSFPLNANVVSFEAPLPDAEGELRGFSWWEISTTKAVDGAPHAYRSFLAPAVERFEIRHGLQPSRRIGLGFSQGGALLSVAAQLDPGRFAGVALLASFVVRLEEVTPAMSPPPQVLIAHGSKDEVVPLSRAEEGAAFLRSRGFGVELVIDDVGHKLGGNGLKALASWLSQVCGYSS